jgi:hypothetical protein
MDAGMTVLPNEYVGFMCDWKFGWSGISPDIG